MKSKFLGLLFFCVPIIAFSQIQILNGSFENCDINNDPCETQPGTPTCENVPYYQSQFVYVANWNRICSADWYCDNVGFFDADGTTNTPANCLTTNINAHDGTHYAGLFSAEAISYNFGSILPKGYYKLTFWTTSCQDFWKVRVYGSDEMITTDDQCNFKVSTGHNLYTLNQQSLNRRLDYDWIQVSVEFNTITKDIQYLSITGDQHSYSKCLDHDYFLVDDVEIEDLGCCPQLQLYQDIGLITSTTDRREFIRAGSDVNPNASSGKVYVLGTANVQFKAGDYISLEPGFEVVPGGVFNAEIGPCTGSSSAAHINWSATGYTPNGDGHNDLWCFSSTNAVYYKVDVVDRWGAVHTYEGEIPVSGIVCLDIDFDALCQSMWSEDGTGPTYDVYIFVYGCGESDGLSTVVSAYCPPPSGKKENSANNIAANFNIYPNPFNDEVIISCPKTENNENINEITFYNLNGQIVKFVKANIISNIIHVKTSDLSAGFYFVKASNGASSYTTKLVKQ